MKVLLTIWISVVLIQEVVPSTLVRRPRSAINNTSLIHTEYEAKYEQKGKHGNQSLSTVTGNHKILHDNCSENWNVFADKCASLIKDLISTLANAVQSNPGDATNLQLHIRNTFRHFDTTHNCTCLNGTESSLSDVNVSPLFQNITINTIPPGSNIIQGSGNSQCSDGQSCDGSSGNGNVVVVDPVALSQQRKPNGLSENADVNPSNAASSNDDSTNNSRRQVDYPRVLKQPQNSFKNSAPATENAQRLTSKLPRNNKSSVPPFLVTPLPNYYPAKSLKVPVVPNTLSTGNGTPASASQVLASPSNGKTALKNSVPAVLVKPQKSGGKTQGQNNLGNSQPVVAVPQVSPLNSNKNSAWPLNSSPNSGNPNKNLKPAVILPAPRNTNFLPPVVVPAGPATDSSNTQSSSSIPVINSNSNLPESSDCDGEESKSQSPVNVAVPTGLNTNPGILSIPESNTKEPVHKSNSISKVKIFPTVPEAANQKARNSEVSVTNSPTGEGDDCEGDNSAANTNDYKTPVVPVPVATGTGDEEPCDDNVTTAPVNTQPVQTIPAVPFIGDDLDESDDDHESAGKRGLFDFLLRRTPASDYFDNDDSYNPSDVVTPAVLLPAQPQEGSSNGNEGKGLGQGGQGQSDPGNLNQLGQGIIPAVLIQGKPTFVPQSDNAQTECDDNESGQNVTPPIVVPSNNGGQMQGVLGQAAQRVAPAVVVPIEKAETECEDDGSSQNVTPPIVLPSNNGDQVQKVLGQAAQRIAPPVVVPIEKAETECEDEGSSQNVTPPIVVPINIEDQVQEVLGQAAQRVAPAVVPIDKAETECEDDESSQNVTPPIVVPIDKAETECEDDVSSQKIAPVVVPIDKAETECDDEGSSQNVTPPIVVPINNEDQVQEVLGQAAQRIAPSVVVPIDKAETECEDDVSSQKIAPPVVVPIEKAETECEDEGSSQNVTPPIVVPINNEDQVQEVLGQAAQRVAPAVVVPIDKAETECEDDVSSQKIAPVVVPIDKAETECEDDGSSQNVTPPIVVPSNNGDQVEKVLGQAAQRIAPSVVVPIDKAETECEDDGSSQNVTPPIVLPSNNGGQVQGVLGQVTQKVAPAVVVPVDKAETECEDEGSSQNVTPPIVVPINIEDQVQEVLGQAAQRVAPAVVPIDKAETECEDDGSSQNVTPPIVVPSNNGGQVQEVLGQAAQRVAPAVAVPIDKAETECEDDGSSQNVTPPIVLPIDKAETECEDDISSQKIASPVVVPIEKAETECEDEGSSQNVTPPIVVPIGKAETECEDDVSSQKIAPVVVPIDKAETECEDDGSSQNVTPPIVLPSNNGGQVQGVLGQVTQKVAPAVVVPDDKAETECEEDGSSPNGQAVIPDVVIPNQRDGQKPLGVTPTLTLPAEPIIAPNSIGQVGQAGSDDLVLTKPTTFQTTSVDPTPPPSPVYLLPTENPVAPTKPSVPQIIKGISLSKPSTTSQDHHDDNDEDDEEDCCSCESCTEEEITDPKQYKENACKNLEEARLELKKIFDKIRKKLKCGRKAPQTITTSLLPQSNPK